MKLIPHWLLENHVEKAFVVEVYSGLAMTLSPPEKQYEAWAVMSRAVWWIDDKPMFGNTSKYDNDESHPYAEIVHLAPGQHTLHVGIISRDNRDGASWRGGYIGIVGILPKFQPSLSDANLDARNARSANGGVPLGRLSESAGGAPLESRLLPSALLTHPTVCRMRVKLRSKHGTR